MKFIALTLLSVASLADAKQTFSKQSTTALNGVQANPDSPPCKDFFSSCWVAAFNSAYAGGDTTANSYEVTSVSNGFVDANGDSNLGTSGLYTYNGGGSYDCQRCNPNFLNAEEHLKMVGNEAVFESELKTCLLTDTSGCPAFGPLTSVSVHFIANELEESSQEVVDFVKEDEQHFTLGLTVAVDGVTGNPDNSKCTDAIESTFVSVYQQTYPDSDAKLKSVEFTNITPGFVASKLLRVGTMGLYTYNGGGSYDCQRCLPVYMTFASKEELLEAVGSSDAFESNLLAALKALTSDECQAFTKITDIRVTWIRDSGLQSDGVDMVNM